jgi:predicted O-methyltransferase YrrM
MHIVNPQIDEYILNVLPPRHEVLTEMDDYARKNNFPIVGPQVGRFLAQLVLITGAKSIFEMGSGFGYSAFWFAKYLKPDGKIICTDGEPDNKDRALKYLKRGGYNDSVEFQVGDARRIIEKYDGPFDIIFNDIDKEQYPEAFDLALPRLRKGGLFITDNVLWSGRMLEDNIHESTAGVIEFNRKLFESEEIFSTIIPIRDGLGVAVKK